MKNWKVLKINYERKFGGGASTAIEEYGSETLGLELGVPDEEDIRLEDATEAFKQVAREVYKASTTGLTKAKRGK